MHVEERCRPHLIAGDANRLARHHHRRPACPARGDLGGGDGADLSAKRSVQFRTAGGFYDLADSQMCCSGGPA